MFGSEAKDSNPKEIVQDFLVNFLQGYGLYGGWGPLYTILTMYAIQLSFHPIFVDGLPYLLVNPITPIALTTKPWTHE